MAVPHYDNEPSQLDTALVYVARGWWLSGAGARGLVDLLFAPAYVAWKVALKVRRPTNRPGEGVRTTRETRS